MNTSGAPQGNHIGLSDQQDSDRKIGEQVRGGIETAGRVDNDEAVVIDQQIEKPSQLARRGLGGIWLLGSGQQMQALFGEGHKAIEQGDVQAVEILQGIVHPKLGPQVEMKSGVTDGSKVDENYISMRTLQGDRGVDGGGGASGASLGADESKHPGLARASETAGTGGTKAGQRLEQRLGAGGVIEVFPGARSHAGNDVGGAGHLAVGEEGNLFDVSQN